MRRSESARAGAETWFHTVLTRLTEDAEPVPDLPAFALDPADARIFAAACDCLSTLDQDWFRAALLAGRTMTECRAADWDELSAQLRVVRYLPALPGSDEINALLHNVDYVGPLLERLADLLTEFRPAGGPDLTMLPWLVYRHLRQARGDRVESAVDWIRVDTLVGHLETLTELAEDRQLGTLAERCLRQLLDTFTVLLQACARRGEWDRVLHYRAGYLARWRPDLVVPGPAPDDDRAQALNLLFANLARMHDLGFRHGALLMENIDPNGGLRAFGDSGTRDPDLQRIVGNLDAAVDGDDVDQAMSAAATAGARRPVLWEPATAKDVTWLAEDLVSLRHQLDPDEWRRGAEMYRTTAQSRQADRVLDRVDELASPSDVERRQRALAPPPLDTPHAQVRVAGLLLRHGLAPRKDFDTEIEQARDIDRSSSRLQRLLRVAEESDGIDGPAHEHAVLAVLALLAERAAVGDFAAVAAGCDATAAVGERISHAPLVRTMCGLAGLARVLSPDTETDAETETETDEDADTDADDDADTDGATDGIGADVSLIRSGAVPPWRRAVVDVLTVCLESALDDTARPTPSAFGPVLDLAVEMAVEMAGVDDQPRLMYRLQTLADRAGPEFTAESGVLDDERLEQHLETAELPDSGISAAALTALRNHDWAGAVRELRRELEEREASHPDDPSSRRIAGQLVLALLPAVEFYPQHTAALTREIVNLGDRHGTALLAEIRDRADEDSTGDDPDAEARTTAANNLGYGLVAAFQPYRDDPARLHLGVDLLTEAVRHTDPVTAPEDYAARANNLALGYQELGALQIGASAIDLFQRAEALLIEVVRVDEELAATGTAEDTRYIDYANLGDARIRLARATYDATWINRKPVESADWYRTGLEAYRCSADLAAQRGRGENEAHANLRLATVCLELCNHYALERYYAGGDLTGAFYRWLCAFAGGQVRTDHLVTSWATEAVARIHHAAMLSVAVNPSLVIECLEVSGQLVGLSLWRGAIPADLGRHALATLVELIDELDDAGLLTQFPDLFGAAADLRPLWTALLGFEAFRTGLVAQDQLTETWRLFERLSRSTVSVVRALAWPWRMALAFEQHETGTLLNGLFIEGEAGGLSLTIPSLRRAVRLGGLPITDLRAVTREVAELRAAGLDALWHLTPMLEWDDLPPYVLLSHGEGITDEDQQVVVETCRLPTSGWDTWLIRVGCPDGGLELTVSLLYLGLYNQVSGVLDADAPGLLEHDGDVLVFGEQGITIEVTAPPADPADRRPVEPESVVRAAVTADPGGNPRLTMYGPELRLLLTASPRIAFSDAAFVVRDDGTSGAAACAATFSHASPSITFPAEAMHGYGPLMFFDQLLDDAALDLIGDIRPRAVVMVGVPDDEADAVALLLDLFDPRRELLWLVEEHEADRARWAIAALTRRIRQTPGAHYLMRAAASGIAPYDPAENVQVVIVPRELAPAAAQMMLDLAGLRRSDIENVPMVIDGRPTYVNLKGNPIAARMIATQFDEPALWDTLVERYCGLVAAPVGRPVMVAPGAEAMSELIALRIPRRPVMLVDEAETPLVAAIAQARLLGAFLLPWSDAALDLLARLNPAQVYVTGAAADRLPAGGWQVIRLPAEPGAMARDFQTRVRVHHSDQMDRLTSTHPHLVASTALLDEMQPANYVVLAPLHPAERAFAYLAANYAASLQAPLYLMPEPPDAFGDLRVRAEDLVTGRVRGIGVTRDVLAHETDVIADGLTGLFSRTCAELDALQPEYVCLVSSFAAFPIELVGDPPLATRYAVGRLAGPDLHSTALLVARAALSEDVNRPADIRAVLAECADAVPGKAVPAARDEVAALHRHLLAQAHVRSRLVTGERDLSDFLAATGDANLVHFAGHCWFDGSRPDQSGLIFSEGVLTANQLSSVLEGLPIVFINACETGLLSRSPEGEGVLWTGMAATFLGAGAVNYVGSLWPVFDEGSRLLAQSFYAWLCAGEPVGEALRRARSEAFERHDSTWSAYVLFGCPHNRLRPPTRGK